MEMYIKYSIYNVPVLLCYEAFLRVHMLVEKEILSDHLVVGAVC